MDSCEEITHETRKALHGLLRSISRSPLGKGK
jgi:hypothetical protein